MVLRLLLILLVCLLPVAAPTAANPLPSGEALSLAWRADSAVLAVGTEGGVTLYDPLRGALIGRLDEPLAASGGTAALAWSPDGEQIAAARYDGVIRLWRVRDGVRRLTLRGHIGAVNGILWSPDGGLIASVGDDFTVRLWQATDGALQQTLSKHRSRAICLVFTPDGSGLVSGGADNRVLLWRVADGSSPNNPQAHRDEVYELAYAPDGTRFASGGADGTVRVWRASGEPLLAFTHGAPVIGLGWDGNFVLSAGRDGVLSVWDTTQRLDQPVRRTETGMALKRAALSPNGAWLALLSVEGALHVLKREAFLPN
jgi:WD40 repeat protein